MMIDKATISFVYLQLFIEPMHMFLTETGVTVKEKQNKGKENEKPL